MRDHVENESFTKADKISYFETRSVSEDAETSISAKKSSECKIRSKTVVDRDYFQIVNERLVDDITVEFFYKPHTLSLLAIGALYIVYTAFTSGDSAADCNAWVGFKATALLFLVVSVLAFPNGPFIRPHPALWRIVFGMSVLYTMLLMFTFFQNFSDIKSVLKWLDPQRLNKAYLTEKEYAVNCSDVSIERLASHLDVFAMGHLLGWTMKAMLVRHAVICWYISIAWEITELVFSHLLPNFLECWWDAILLDIVVCNGLGIWLGLFVCRKLEMSNFHWESIKCLVTDSSVSHCVAFGFFRSIASTRGKFKRAVLQFTPASWTTVDWFDSGAGRRSVAVYVFVVVWLVTELNTFFLKHIFAIDTDHPMIFYRILLIGAICAPTTRQYYLYVTDPKIKRLGMQCWMYLAVTILESSICIKFGRRQLPGVHITLVVLWIIFLYTKEVHVNGHLHHHYLDSSCENLGALEADVKMRRRKMFQLSESDVN